VDRDKLFKYALLIALGALGWYLFPWVQNWRACGRVLEWCAQDVPVTRQDDFRGQCVDDLERARARQGRKPALRRAGCILEIRSCAAIERCLGGVALRYTLDAARR
jgi:hypothetical protein